MLEMTVKQAEKLSESVTHKQWDDLYSSAASVNRSQVNIPKSFAASAILASSVPKSKPPRRGVSAENGSSDESLAG